MPLPRKRQGNAERVSCQLARLLGLRVNQHRCFRAPASTLGKSSYGHDVSSHKKESEVLSKECVHCMFLCAADHYSCIARECGFTQKKLHSR